MNILLTGMHKYTEENLNDIKDLGYQIFFQEKEDEVIAFDVSEIEIVVCVDIFKVNDIKRFKNLKYIQLLTVGFDTMPLEHIKENKIILTNAKNTFSIPMSEWAILKVLEVLKRSREYINNQNDKEWLRNVESVELYHKNVLLMGYGNVAKDIKKRLMGFDVNIFVYNRSTVNDKDVKQIELTAENLKDIDIVIITLPLAENTYHMVNKEFLKMLKDNIVLINLARGSVINEVDLIEALSNNKFIGLGLDVFEVEPLPKESVLWNDHRVYITPHYSYYSDKIKERQFSIVFERLKEIV